MAHITEEEIAASELRNAAYHEAGHKILYERFGGAGDAVIRRNESGNPEERAWRGQFRPRTCPEDARNVAIQCGFPAAVLPANWKVVVGMAGLLAEEILDCGTDDVETLAEGLLRRITAGEASASDLALMNISDIDKCELNYKVVDEAARLLREGWVAVQQEAEYLIEFAESEPACQ
ncbi:hypothetical protein [Paraburkholderia dilworthii]|uniref:Peptidase family M41 n=1 Tax=Paraburkholderia dilworthii TaxID=948106 RepID=A0ABW9DHY8_9BURK